LKCGALALATALLAGCGGGGGGGQGPTTPPTTMPPVGANSVDVLVFYDENGNGLRNPGERTRIPEALVEIGTRTARSAPLTGEARIDGLTDGQYEVGVRADSLPPFYVPGPPIAVSVPANQVVEIPVQLPIGRNLPNRYMAFGDSITEGDSDFGDFTYRRALQSLLEGHFGVAEILNSGAGGTTTDQGAARIDDELTRNDPAFVIVVYGTNDWNACITPENCFTQNALRSIVRAVKLKGAHAFVSTIPPVNVGFDDRVPPERQDWVDNANVLIRTVVREEGSVLIDVNAAMKQAAAGDLSALFEDHVHPNPAGYDVMAQAMFEAIARGQVGVTGDGGVVQFGFRH
jgi:lysophospholipase L1-like esterase